MSCVVVSAAEKEEFFVVTGSVMTDKSGKWLANTKPNDANTRIFAALPSRKALGRFIRVFSPKTGKEIRNVPVEDVGPWSTNDNFFETGQRPKAELGISNIYKKVKNKASIDLSLKLCLSLGLKYPYLGPIYWKFETCAKSDKASLCVKTDKTHTKKLANKIKKT